VWIQAGGYRKLVKKVLDQQENLEKLESAKWAEALTFFPGGTAAAFDVLRAINSSKWLPILKKFAVSEHTEENIDFLLAIKGNPKGVPGRKVYLQYVAPDAPDQVNVGDAVVKYFQALDGQGAWNSPDWSKAQAEIVKVIKQHTGLKFWASEMLYKTL
jgi:hypothetical protein